MEKIHSRIYDIVDNKLLVPSYICFDPSCGVINKNGIVIKKKKMLRIAFSPNADHLLLTCNNNNNK
jgi:hypothetical protein